MIKKVYIKPHVSTIQMEDLLEYDIPMGSPFANEDCLMSKPHSGFFSFSEDVEDDSYNDELYKTKSLWDE